MPFFVSPKYLSFCPTSAIDSLLGLMVTFIHRDWANKCQKLTQMRFHSIYYHSNPCWTIYQHVQYHVEDKSRTDILSLLMTLIQLVKVKCSKTVLRNQVTYRNDVHLWQLPFNFSMSSQSSIATIVNDIVIHVAHDLDSAGQGQCSKSLLKKYVSCRNSLVSKKCLSNEQCQQYWHPWIMILIMTLLMTLTQLVKVKCSKAVLRNQVTYRNDVHLWQLPLNIQHEQSK